MAKILQTFLKHRSFKFELKSPDIIRKWLKEVPLTMFKKKKTNFKSIHRLQLRNQHFLQKCKTSNLSRDELYRREFYVENGLRKIYPYHDIIFSNAKEMMWGGTILSALKEMYPRQTDEQLIQSVQDGRTLINNQKVRVDCRLKCNDIIGIWVHRHEFPVMNKTINIIEDNADVVVVDKPASMPVHPCGNYIYNSVTKILKHEYGYTHLYPTHRLDRATSGVFIMPKTHKYANKLQKQFKSRIVKKEYLARVVGEFPEGVVTCDVPMYKLDADSGLPSLHVTVPVFQGHRSVTAKTVFERVSFNGKTSVVNCKPFTGRTHQIRVHLQYLGHPIVNDGYYNSPAFGENRGKGGKYEIPFQDIILGIGLHENTGRWTEGSNLLYEKRLETIGRGDRKCKLNIHNIVKRFGQDVKELKNVYAKNMGKRIVLDEFDEEKWIPYRDCIYCKKNYVDPKPENLMIYLHALRYSGPDWSYITPFPEWANED